MRKSAFELDSGLNPLTIGFVSLNETPQHTTHTYPMALSNGGNAFSSEPLIFLAPRSKDKDGNKVPPHFAVGRVDASGEIQNTDETFVKVTGDLIRAEVKDKEFKGNLTKQVKLYIRDSGDARDPETKKETYHIQSSLTISFTGLLNALASLIEVKNFKDLTVDIYENKKGFEAFGVEQAGEKVKWKYTLDDLPKPLAINHPTTGKLIKNDYAERDEFFAQIVRDINTALGNKPKEAATESAPAETAAPAKPAPAAKTTTVANPRSGVGKVAAAKAATIPAADDGELEPPF